MLIVLFSNASSKPGAMMVHFFNADTTCIAMRCPRRSVYIASHAKLNRIDFRTIGDDIFNLNMAFYMLIFGYDQEFALHLISFILNKPKCYDFLNYARLSGCDPDERVKVYELKNDEDSDDREVVLSAKPAQMQYFM